MIRRDYILRMVAEFLELLSRIQSLKRDQRWQEARGTLEEQCRNFMGAGVLEIARLSETELLAKLIQGEPTQVVRDKVFILTRLLKEAGDVATGEGRLDESRTFYLKGLHLLLYTLAQGNAAEWPDFVPRVDMLVAADNLRLHRAPVSSHWLQPLRSMGQTPTTSAPANHEESSSSAVSVARSRSRLNSVSSDGGTTKMSSALGTRSLTCWAPCNGGGGWSRSASGSSRPSTG